MANAIIEFFGGFIGNIYLLTACLSLLPVTEIKGSILFAVSAGAEPLLAAGCALLSSALLAALLVFCYPFLLSRAERSLRIRKVTSFLTSRLTERAERLNGDERADHGNRGAFGVFLFVAIPLPLTGIWTGAMLAALLRLDRKIGFFTLVAGNFTAIGIVLAVALLAGDRANIVFDAFLLLAALFLVVAIVKSLVRKGKKKDHA